jgi:hypothetical protein
MCLKLLASLGGGRRLARGEAVHRVVVQDVGDVHVASGRVYEVGAPDAHAVPVAGHGDDGHVVDGQLDAGGRWQAAAVQRVEAVQVDEVGQFGRAADARGDHDLVGTVAQLRQRLLEGVDDAEVAATRAPVDLLPGLEVGRLHQSITPLRMRTM